MRIVLFVIGFIAIYGKPNIAAPDLAMTRSCSNRMSSELPENFAKIVAHGSHSMTKQDIQYYFPTEKEDIALPTVNPDMLSRTPILSQPAEFQHSFTSPALRVVDQVLSHMRSPEYYLRNYNDLEKMVHAAHMQDVWAEASRAYSKLQESKSDDDGLCACIRDVENNGIMKAVTEAALELAGGESIGAYWRSLKAEVEILEDDRSKTKEILPEITNTDAWNNWKEELMSMQPRMEEYGKQLALYMHCMLQ